MGVFIEIAELRNRTRVFADRLDAGKRLATMMAGDIGLYTAPIVCAILSGGVPVGVGLSKDSGIEIEGLVVSKITFPWDSESGFGACAFDGNLIFNTPLMESLSDSDIGLCVEKARSKVGRRMELLFGERAFPDLSGKAAIIVDDGLASGFTVRAALEAVRNKGAERLVVASPTGSLATVRAISLLCDCLYCANVRNTPRFAVAEAYERWYDEDEAAAIDMLKMAREDRLGLREKYS